ncbi:MAG: YicC family protein [bacterium]|nr:YicC family protein [bacterium]MDY3861537.1 YicC/YloC family endoribonuclease [Ruminococcus sp.]
MIKSMTGFGRSQRTVDGREITVEIKSVNHRYFEFSCRTTRGYGFLEEKLKSYISQRVARGKVDMFVSLSAPQDEQATVTVNHRLASGYISAMRELGKTYGLADDISITAVAGYPDIFTVSREPEDEEKVCSDVLSVVDEALEAFISMREAEGERLKADILARVETILSIVEKIEKRSPETVSEYEKRLKDKITETLGDRTIDEQRVLTEVAIFSDKVAVAEETVRLRSHMAQLKKFFESDMPAGRKTDFIIQEMNREANTIGSKVQDAEIAHMVVDIKAEIEKIREQVQNVE